MATADAPEDNLAARYYNGRPLNYDEQQAQAAPPARPQPAVAGEQASAQPATQPPPPRDAGEKASNHTHVHGVPGYYNGPVNKTNTAASDKSPAAAAAAPTPPAPAAPPPVVEPEKELSCIDKLLWCFTGGKNTK